MAPVYDLFLSHNSRDKPAVREIAKALRALGLRVWLDEDDLVPGRPWQEALEEIIQTAKAAAVLVGRDGLGPWENQEMRGCLSEFVDRRLPVIPVLLPGAPVKPDLPFFLRAFTWVDLRDGITFEGLDRLVWGITGEKQGTRVELGPPPLPGLPLLHNLPFPPLGDLLKGRDEELRKLAESLESGGRAAIVQHRALYGLGGIGKTRLAVEHAWTSGYRAAFFVRADTPEGLRTGLAALARADLLNLGESRAEDEVVHAVLGWLKTNPGWLLILDNVDTPEAESAVLKLLPGLTGGRVLITSRRQGWPPWVHTEPPGLCRFYLRMRRSDRAARHNDGRSRHRTGRRRGPTRGRRHKTPVSRRSTRRLRRSTRRLRHSTRGWSHKTSGLRHSTRR